MHYLACFILSHFLVSQANEPYTYYPGTNGSFISSLKLTSPEAFQLMIFSQPRNCSTFVMSNVSMSSNVAKGAGGAVYSTSPDEVFHLV